MVARVFKIKERGKRGGVFECLPWLVFSFLLGPLFCVWLKYEVIARPMNYTARVILLLNFTATTTFLEIYFFNYIIVKINIGKKDDYLILKNIL